MLTNHSSKGDGSGGMVVDCDEVDEEGHATDEGRQQKGTHHHLLDPHLACTTHTHKRWELSYWTKEGKRG